MTGTRTFATQNYCPHKRPVADQGGACLSNQTVAVYFSDFFRVPAADLEKHGAVNISLINDLPLFIDPFLLFNSPKPEYRLLHNEVLRYLRFIRDRSVSQGLSEGLLRAWLTFPEVKQTWLGFSLAGNAGRGLGMDFARALQQNLASVFSSFGNEQVTRSSHLEKLCLLDEGVGRDKISDFVTNLIKRFLLDYTAAFANRYLSPEWRRRVNVPKVTFNYHTETWESSVYELPWHPFVDDYVLLVPKDLLTKMETWINKPELYHRFLEIANGIPNAQLREQVNNYFTKALPEEPSKEDEEKAVAQTLRKFPELIEWYIRAKEDSGDEAIATSARLVSQTENLIVRQLGAFIAQLAKQSSFYSMGSNTLNEARSRVMYLKDMIENKGGYRIFYVGGTPIRREADVQIMFRLTWYATPSDISREVNDGRGPVDFKASRGASDKTLIEFKLASNKQLATNLAKQVEIYKQASDAKSSLKVIVYFSDDELKRTLKTLKALGLDKNEDVILIDARADNKPSGSKAA